MRLWKVREPKVQTKGRLKGKDGQVWRLKKLVARRDRIQTSTRLGDEHRSDKCRGDAWTRHQRVVGLFRVTSTVTLTLWTPLKPTLDKLEAPEFIWNTRTRRRSKHDAVLGLAGKSPKTGRGRLPLAGKGWVNFGLVCFVRSMGASVPPIP
ncbi:hypothetical protein VTI74DRAFT_7881 [Chaetomium olivicolor]